MPFKSSFRCSFNLSFSSGQLQMHVVAIQVFSVFLFTSSCSYWFTLVSVWYQNRLVNLQNLLVDLSWVMCHTKHSVCIIIPMTIHGNVDIHIRDLQLEIYNLLWYILQRNYNKFYHYDVESNGYFVMEGNLHSKNQENVTWCCMHILYRKIQDVNGINI